MADCAAARRFIGVWLTGLLVSGCAPDGRGLAAGDAAPALLSTTPGVRVAWVVREDDLLACGDRARALRALQRRYAPRISFHLVVVGADGGLARGFLRRERLDAVLEEIDERTYREQFGATATPALLVTNHGRVRAVWRDRPGEPRSELREPRLDDVLGTILPR